MRSEPIRSSHGVWLLVVGLLFVGLFEGGFPAVLAQRPAAPVPERSTGGGEFFHSHSLEFADGKQQITLIDARSRAMAVYHVDPRTGAIALKSVRNVHWDLQMDEFNSGGNPSPKEIRSLLEQR